MLRILVLAAAVAPAAAFSLPRPAAGLDRRRLVEGFSAAIAGAALAPGVTLAAPNAAGLEEPLNRILRVLEATQQEERLIKSGKFKDLQRANVKMAVDMMLSNYKLQYNLNAALGYVDADKVPAASEVARTAVEYLTQIGDYFDTGKKSLQVNEMSSEKAAFVLKALGATRTQLEGFLEFLPKDSVNAAQAVIEKENEVNIKEFDGELYNMPKKA
eukprot:CAMPEP_0118853800 /NCGR_PEP_ID=MMETSP1163-20130328/2254_1 /TAXON_ID=124430 /ORGANISM="Phaeomonas parva, Strain CCMP2877" /LENGTH=214 /DNA_ID=CAMNT_0006786413 /DNA_START=200 /DNA_END=844 /DNA_ORIENTATION=+